MTERRKPTNTGSTLLKIFLFIVLIIALLGADAADLPSFLGNVWHQIANLYTGEAQRWSEKLESNKLTPIPTPSPSPTSTASP